MQKRLEEVKSLIDRLVEDAYNQGFADGSKGLLKKPLPDGLSWEDHIKTMSQLKVREINAMMRGGIVTIADLAQRTVDDIRRLRNMGTGSVNHLLHTLHEHYGIWLKGEATPRNI